MAFPAAKSATRPRRRSQRRLLGYCLIFVAVLSALNCWLLVAVSNSGKQPPPEFLISKLQKGETRSSSTRKLKNEFVSQVSCDELWAKARNETDLTLTDINRGMGDAVNRQTITDPPFWISLHKEWYDPLRWKSVMNHGEYYEVGITEQFKIILGGAPPGLVIDVGMNIGWFSLWSRKLGHNVVAFEPNPQNHLRMCTSLNLNGWDKDDSVGLYQYGVGDSKGRLTLQWGRNPGMATFHADRLAKKTVKTNIEVATTTLDDAFAEILKDKSDALSVHLLKVDVEGHELPVFRGAKRLIRSGRIRNILMEWTSNSKQDTTELFEILLGSGYELHLISSDRGEAILQTVTDKIRGIKVTGDSSEHLKPIDSELDRLAKAGYALNLWWMKT